MIPEDLQELYDSTAEWDGSLMVRFAQTHGIELPWKGSPDVAVRRYLIERTSTSRQKQVPPKFMPQLDAWTWKQIVSSVWCTAIEQDRRRIRKELNDMAGSLPATGNGKAQRVAFERALAVVSPNQDQTSV